MEKRELNRSQENEKLIEIESYIRRGKTIYPW